MSGTRGNVVPSTRQRWSSPCASSSRPTTVAPRRRLCSYSGRRCSSPLAVSPSAGPGEREQSAGGTPKVPDVLTRRQPHDRTESRPSQQAPRLGPAPCEAPAQPAPISRREIGVHAGPAVTREYAVLSPPARSWAPAGSFGESLRRPLPCHSAQGIQDPATRYCSAGSQGTQFTFENLGPR